MNRRGFLKALGVGGAAVAAFGLTGCGRDEDQPEAPLADPAERRRVAVIAREQLREITGDVNTLNNVLRGLNNEMIATDPLFFTNDQIDPADVSRSMVIINVNEPEKAKIDQLYTQVVQLAGSFGRMNWDKENPDSEDHVFTPEQIAEAGDDIIARGVSLERRFREMRRNAERAGIISYGQVEAEPSPVR